MHLFDLHARHVNKSVDASILSSYLFLSRFFLSSMIFVHIFGFISWCVINASSCGLIFLDVSMFITSKLSIEPGAVFGGTCNMGGIVKDLPKSSEDITSEAVREEKTA